MPSASPPPRCCWPRPAASRPRRRAGRVCCRRAWSCAPRPDPAREGSTGVRMVWKRFAVLGVGSRGEWWSRAIAKQFGGRIAIVALCDHNAGRNQRLAGLLAEHGQQPALYADFARMLAEAKPDAVLIAVPDHE